jgi:hypothetical protein
MTARREIAGGSAERVIDRWKAVDSAMCTCNVFREPSASYQSAAELMQGRTWLFRWTLDDVLHCRPRRRDRPKRPQIVSSLLFDRSTGDRSRKSVDRNRLHLVPSPTCMLVSFCAIFIQSYWEWWCRLGLRLADCMSCPTSPPRQQLRLDLRTYLQMP